MLQSLIIISACIFGIRTFEVYDEKYFLSTTGSPEHVNGLEDSQNKCGNSWLLEIYDVNVAALLKKLNVNIQQNGILLGMKRDSNSWRWSDGTMFSGSIIDQDITSVVACITNKNNKVEFVAKTIFDSAGVICSKVAVSTKDNCTGWFHNGFCYFKPTNTYNWFEAHNECIKNGAFMAMFNNSETNFNMSFIDNQLYWVSLSRSTWMWTHANKALTFNKWESGQPFTNNLQTCVATNLGGNEWKPVNCGGTYHIVCMREMSPENPGITKQANNSTTTSVTPNIYHEPSTQSLLPKPGGSSNCSEHANEEPLSSGAKAGIGIGVSLMVIIIIIIVGVLVFKYFHHCKKSFERKNSRKPLEHENHYAEIVPGNMYTASSDNNHSAISYADLDLQSRGTLANDD